VKEVAGLPGRAAERLPNRLEPGARLLVVSFHGHHRILKVREDAIGRTDRIDRAGDEAGRALRG
jgi:hypothetical protein